MYVRCLTASRHSEHENYAALTLILYPLSPLALFQVRIDVRPGRKQQEGVFGYPRVRLDGKCWFPWELKKKL